MTTPTLDQLIQDLYEALSALEQEASWARDALGLTGPRSAAELNARTVLERVRSSAEELLRRKGLLGDG